MMMTFFYASIMPFCIIYSIIGLTLFYWSNKYNLLRRKTVKNNLNINIAIRIIAIIEYIVPIYCIANMIFISYIKNG